MIISFEAPVNFCVKELTEIVDLALPPYRMEVAYPTIRGRSSNPPGRTHPKRKMAKTPMG